MITDWRKSLDAIAERALSVNIDREGGSSRKDLKSFPAEVQDEMGYALRDAQFGGRRVNAKVLTGFGGRACWRSSTISTGRRTARSTRSDSRARYTCCMPLTLVLYDVTSTYFEGRTCPLARHGYSRDQKKGKLQIVFGLLGSAQGCPVAVEVFPGNTGDPKTLAPAVERVCTRFGLKRVVLVADRGLLTEARVEAELRPLEGRLDWITALRAPAIRKLFEEGDLQLSFSSAKTGDPAFAL
jgi:hypothetical protein